MICGGDWLPPPGGDWLPPPGGRGPGSGTWTQPWPPESPEPDKQPVITRTSAVESHGDFMSPRCGAHVDRVRAADGTERQRAECRIVDSVGNRTRRGAAAALSVRARAD